MANTGNFTVLGNDQIALIKTIDKSVKNKLNFKWLEEEIKVKDFTVKLGDTIHKINISGKACCKLFHSVINYDTPMKKSMLTIPEDALNDESDDEEKANPDHRISIRQTDKRIACDEEYSDSEDEDGGRKDRRDHKKKRQKTDNEEKKDGEKETKKDEKEVKKELPEVKEEPKPANEKEDKMSSSDKKDSLAASKADSNTADSKEKGSEATNMSSAASGAGTTTTSSSSSEPEKMEH